MWGVIMSKRITFLTEFLILSDTAIIVPQIAQAHTSEQSLSSSEANHELNDLFDNGQP